MSNTTATVDLTPAAPMPACTVQLFVSTRDADTLRTRDDWQNYPTAHAALVSLLAYAAEENYTVTPAVDADGEIVYHLAGEDICEGSVATIS